MNSDNEVVDATNSKFIKSNEESQEKIKSKKVNANYHYIDIIAIIQKIKFKDEVIEAKLPWYKKIFNFLKGKK